MAVFHRRVLPSQLPTQTVPCLEFDGWCKNLSTAKVQWGAEQYGILCLPVQARRHHVLGLISHAAALIAIQSRQGSERPCTSPGVSAEVWLVDVPKGTEEQRSPPRWSLAIPLFKGVENFQLTPWQHMLQTASLAARISWCIQVAESLLQLHKQPIPLVLQGLGLDSLFLEEPTGRVQLWLVGAHKLQRIRSGDVGSATNPDDKGSVCEWEMAPRPAAKRKQTTRTGTESIYDLEASTPMMGSSLPPKAVSCPQLNTPSVSSESLSSAHKLTFESMLQQPSAVTKETDSTDSQGTQVQTGNSARHRVKFYDAVSEPLPKVGAMNDGYFEFENAPRSRRLSVNQLPEQSEHQTLKSRNSTPAEGFHALAAKSIAKPDSPSRHRPALRSQSRLSLVSKPNHGGQANTKSDDHPSSGSVCSTQQGTMTHRLSCHTDDSDLPPKEPCDVPDADDCEAVELPDMIMNPLEFLLPVGNATVGMQPPADVAELKAVSEEKHFVGPPSSTSTESSNPSNMPPGSGLRFVAQRSIDSLAKSQKSMKRTPPPKPPVDTVHITDLPDPVLNTSPSVFPTSTTEIAKAKSCSRNVIPNVPWLKLPGLANHSATHNSMPTVFPKTAKPLLIPEQPLGLIQAREETAGATASSAYNHLCMMLNGGQYNTLMKASGTMLQAGPKLSPPSLAPEVFLNISEHDCASDVFTFGVLMYQLLTASTTISQMPRQELAKKLSTGWRPPCLTDIHFGAWQLINRCWARYPKARPSMDEVLCCLKALHQCVLNDEKDQQTAFTSSHKLTSKNLGKPGHNCCCIM